MGLSFFERMDGDLVDRWGRNRSIDFEIKAEASHLARFARDGKMLVTGIVHLDGWIDEAAFEGNLRISPFRNRRIEYELEFRSDQGRKMRLLGQKNLTPFRPIHSATTMDALLFDGQGELARGQMKFDERQIPAFFKSWWPSASFRTKDLRPKDEGPPTIEPLNKRERACFEALARAAIAPGEHVPAVDETTIVSALKMLDEMPDEILLGYRAALRLLDGYAKLRYLSSFASLSERSQKDLLNSWSERHRVLGKVSLNRLLLLLTMPIKTVHFDREDFLQSVGVRAFTHEVREEPPRYLAQVVTAEEIDAETTIEADVVVVGTGAGGGAIAATLAERGLGVAFVEEGRYATRAEFSGGPLDRVQRFWRQRGMTFSAGAPPISIPLGKLVGGTTAINSGTCFATPEPVLRQWREELGFPADFSALRFHRYLSAVETELQVGPSEAAFLGRIAEKVALGADRLGLSHEPLPRNAPGCDGQGVCMLGCPTGAKRSTNVSYVPRALKAGAGLYTGLAVTRIMMHGGRAAGVEAKGVDIYGAPKTLRVHARAVVLACGSLITPLMLRDNGFRLPWIGRNLSVHPGLGMFALFDERMDPWSAVPQGYGVDYPADPDIRFEGFYLPPQIFGAMVPLVREELTRWMDGQAHLGQFGFMVRDENVGRVRRSHDGRPLVLYSLTPATVERLKRGASILAEILLEGGGREVLAGLGEVATVRTVSEARAIKDARVSAMDFNLLGAHPLGTCRMARSAEEGVTDFEHRVFGTDNLYVVDGSSVPTSLGVNPQITIMALATRAGEILADRLS